MNGSPRPELLIVSDADETRRWLPFELAAEDPTLAIIICSPSEVNLDVQPRAVIADYPGSPEVQPFGPRLIERLHILFPDAAIIGKAPSRGPAALMHNLDLDVFASGGAATYQSGGSIKHLRATISRVVADPRETAPELAARIVAHQDEVASTKRLNRAADLLFRRLAAGGGLHGDASAEETADLLRKTRERVGDWQRLPTQRQWEILDRLGDGLIERAIAREMAIRADSVKKHIKDLKRRLGVGGGLYQLALAAVARGLIPPISPVPATSG